MRVVFMGTPEFAVPILESLTRDYQVVGVYTRPDRPGGRGQQFQMSPVKRLALGRGLPLFQPPSLKVGEERDRLGRLAPELIVVAAFGLLLPPEVLALPPFSCLNVHPSLLPRYRGPAPVQAALLAGDEVVGISLMLMDQGLDTGPLLAQLPLPVLPQDNAGTLMARLAEVAVGLLRETLPRWLQGEVTPQPQPCQGVSYSRRIAKGDGELDWSLPALGLWRRVRAFTPWPGAFTLWQGKQLKIASARPILGEMGEPGRVRGLGRGAGVETGQGVLELKTVQLEGKRPLSIEDFLRGQRSFIGALLGK